ncbi:MAG: copper resistance system multicopper oxidase [Gammaproteobacteria bacterium]|nr:copper resistance system multicopper oxidase [Gammaproteobacteria bacterium]
MKDNRPVLATYQTLPLSRRRFVAGLAAGGTVMGLGLGSRLALGSSPPRGGPPTLRGKHFNLNIGYQAVNFTGKERIATAVNGSVPAPVLRWREGEQVSLRVTNNLAHDSSIHWHGMILPTNMDGVPGLSFDGIKPGETFEYQFEVNQSGTFWYHSHSGFQEQTGMYGAIVIAPKEPDPVSYDRDHVVVLSDWSDEAPEDIYAKLKKLSHYYNFRERTASDLWRDVKEKGVSQTWQERSMWNQMRMSDTDISDVTGYTYTFLMNGVTPEDGWQGLFQRGEKVRLRFINSAAMTIFDVRIPGLKMTVVAADGQNIDPVTIDEFRIGVAETYDVIVEPSDDSAYTIFAQSIDRTGYTRGTLTPDASWTAEVPSMDPAPTLGHRDMGMGMDHSMHGMTGMGSGGMEQHDMSKMSGTDHSKHSGMQVMDHSGHQGMAMPLGKAGFGSSKDITHALTEFGPQVDMRADSPQSGLDDPGIGLRNHAQAYGRRVLTYRDICNYYPTADRREPSREIELHLTGNMSRYMWSINGIKFADAEPIHLTFGERVRFTLTNDTMMTHPIHLHGMWSELETGDPHYIPRKHTILVQPGSTISYLVTADAYGRWAYHCHLLYHMPGMFREVRVS